MSNDDLDGHVVRATTPTSEGLLGLLIESVTDYAIFLLDPDGHVASWNAGARRLKGYRAEEIIGTHYSRFYPDEDVRGGKPERQLARAAADGRVEDEGWRIRKDGVAFWANVVITALRDETGKLLGFGKVTRDLTERRAAERSLTLSEERLRLMVENVVDYAIFMLDPTGHVATWNAGARRLKGYASGEIIGSHFSRFYPQADIEAGKPDAELREAVAVGRVEDEGWRVRKDGSRFWANVVITALRDDDGRLRGFAKVTRDLTERRRAEEALAESLRLEQAAADRLRELDRTKNEFVAMVAHDLRSPIRVVTGYVQLLLSRWDRLDEATRREYLETVLRSARNSYALIDDVLEVARIESGDLRTEPEPYDLEALVRETAAEATLPGAAIEIRVDGPLPAAYGDRRRHWQVLGNLLANAVRYSPPDRPPEMALTVSGDFLEVAVRDHGPGIRAEDEPRLFQRFSRIEASGDEPETGTGLGLYITRSLVEAQGGQIWVESTRGEGSTFRFTVPIARASSTAPPPGA